MFRQMLQLMGDKKICLLRQKVVTVCGQSEVNFATVFGT